MPLIRALTLLLPQVKDFALLKEEVRGLKEVKELLGDVWTLRISSGVRLPHEEVKYLTNEGFLINSFHEDLTNLELDDLINYLSLGRTYVALGLKDNDILKGGSRRVFNVLRRVKDELGPEALARTGFYIGGEIETPYFPLSYPVREGVSVALRYADVLTRNTPENYVDVIANTLSTYERRIKPVLQRKGLNYLGIDASLSPWMDESVVPAIERISRTKFPNPGSAYGVKKVNEMISIALGVSKASSLGFNEVMLPVGEDSVLKDLVREGELRLEHLSFLTSYCVAGVDMVVIDESVPLVEGVVKDLIAASAVKNKPVGMRLILSDSEEVKIPSFGSIPKIKTSHS